jgi:hypothetical protein
MIGEPDAGNPHVRFDEGVQETCDSATRLCPTLPERSGVPFTLDPGAKLGRAGGTRECWLAPKMPKKRAPAS